MDDHFFQPLEVNLTGDIRHDYDEKRAMPAHELVLRPLVTASKEILVYQGRKDDSSLAGGVQTCIQLGALPILIKEKGKFKFDQAKECIAGHEYLWNATEWKRGSIVFILDVDKTDFSEVFKNTYRPGLSATPNAGNNASATKRCRAEAEKGGIAICLPASNGIEWMSIYAKGDLFKKIVEQAEQNCHEKDYYK